MTVLLSLLGYVVALTALYVAFAPRRRRAPHLLRPALCSLALFAAAVSTIAIANTGGPAALRVVTLVCSVSTAVATVGWLFVNIIGSFERPKRHSRPAAVDFSFLNTLAENDQRGATESESASRPKPKLNHRRWIERLKMMKVLHRWSFLSDPP